jgi:recombination protein RecA
MTRNKESLTDALKALEKKHGAGTVMRLGKGEQVKKAETLTTGIYSIDKALGGGFARGRMIELYGGEGSGKTTLALQVIVQCQKRGEKAAYIDVEHAFDMEYAKALGIDLEELYFSQPDSAEAAMDIAKTLASTGEFAMIVIDSVAALTPETEFEGEVGKSQIGHLARFMSTALKQVVSEFSKTNTTLVLINQLRMKIGVMFGNPETTPGGNALKYYASQRIAIRRSSAIKDSAGEQIGYEAAIKVEKNKIALPFQKAKVPFMHGIGFDAVADIFFFAETHGIIEKQKATYFFGDEKLAVGAQKTLDHIRETPELLEKIKEAIEKLLNKPKEETT